MYWPISEGYISYLNWRQKIPCYNIHVFFIHYPTTLDIWLYQGPLRISTPSLKIIDKSIPKFTSKLIEFVDFFNNSFLVGFSII